MANTFQLSRAVNTPLSFGAPEPLTVADFDGDGLGDIAVASPAGDRFQLGVYLNQGDQTFAETQVLNDVPEQEALAAGDLNGDGDADLVQVGSDSQAVTVLFGDGQGAFPTRTQLDTTHNPKSVAIADMNGDGHRDLVVGTNNRGGVAIHLGDGQGGFSEAPGLVDGVRRAVALETGDVNNDGHADVIAHDAGRVGTVQVLAGDGQGGLSLVNTVDFTDDISRPRDLGVGDFDNDGHLDWVAAELEQDKVEVFFGDGDGGVARRAELPAEANPRTIDVADFNRDGEADLAIAHGQSQNVLLYEGHADGSFTRAHDAAVNGDDDNLNQAASGDLDGDGFPDLVLSNATNGGVVSVLENRGGLGLPAVEVELAWTRQLGTADDDSIVDTATTANGELIVVGHEDVSPGGKGPVFVARYDQQGNQIWRDTFGANATGVGEVGLDADGNIYVTGSVELDELGGLDNHFTTLNSGSGAHGAQDLYLAKYGSDGEQQWLEQFGSPDVDKKADLAIGANGTVYVSGRASGPFVPAHQEPGTSNDVAVTAFSGGGNLQWSRLIGSGASDNAAEIEVDPSSGELVVAGWTSGDFGTLATDGGNGLSAAPGFVGQADADHRGFYLRLDPDQEGQVIQVRQFEFRTGGDTIDGLTVNDLGEVTIVGETQGLDAGRGVPVFSIQIPYARRFDAAGERLWTRQDSSRNDVGIGQDGHSDAVEGPFGLHYVSGGARAHMSVYDDDGRLRADVTDEFFSQAGGAFDDGATTLASAGTSVYVAGNTNHDWAGPAQGGDDGWIARLDIGLDASERPDLDLLALQNEEAVSAMYVGWFGRAPRIAGQDFWAGELERGLADGKGKARTIEDIAESFRLSGEARSLYPVLDQQDPDEAELDAFLTDLYQNLFDRAPSAAGLDFWTGEIETRLAQGRAIGDIIFDVISGAQNDVLVDTDGDDQGDTRFNDAATVLNRIEVATAHGKAVDAARFDLAESASLIAGVGTGGLGRDAALAAVDQIAAGRDPVLPLSADGTAVDPLLA